MHTFFGKYQLLVTLIHISCGTFEDFLAHLWREGQAWENILSQHLTLLPQLTRACLHNMVF